MPVVDAFGDRRVAEVVEDTWGHMRAHPNVWQHGKIVFAEGAFGGEQIILACDFGEDAGYGPWFYEQIHDWLCDQKTEPGNLYTFTGWYRVKRDDSYQFRGKIATTSLEENR